MNMSEITTDPMSVLMIDLFACQQKVYTEWLS
jgi:hypothetical protein